MDKRAINPSPWLLEFGINHGVEVTGAQRTLYLSGQTSTGSDGTPKHEGDLAAQLRSGELELVLEDYEVQDAATWIVYPAREHLPTRVRFLVDFLSERLKQAELLIEHVDRNKS